MSANANTIQDKVLVGYQGWFTCPGDGEPIGPGHHGWLHWFDSPIQSGGRPNVDLWPDTADYDPSELFPVPGLATQSGDPVHLFSSRNPRTVQRHFHWMATHGVDGAFLQRFAGQCELKPGNHAIRDLRDEVGDRVREAAEAEGRVFAIMYDVSGVSPDKIRSILERDWAHLVQDKHVLDSPSYLREQGRPVVALWGFGLSGRNHTPELVRAIVGFFRSFTPGGVYLVAGTPGHWRTSTSDADRNPAFVQMWTDCFDAICPWTVGRYGNDDVDRWGQERIQADADYLKSLGGRKVDYIPVVLPGGSGFNMSGGKWAMNDIRRNGGRFLWQQIYNARRAGVCTIYGAMWDEYDEGTAFMPVVSYASQLPVHPSFRFLALDVDGHDLPSDWYMRIMGFAADVFHGRRTLPDTFPIKELQDYWSARPRLEGGNAGQADVETVTRAFQAWEVSEGNANAGALDAPPPYSLEDTTPHPAKSTPASTGPPLRHDTRPSPSPSLSTSACLARVSAAAPSGRASPSGKVPLTGRTPPPVNLTSRPSVSSMTRPHIPGEIGMPVGGPPHVPQRHGSSSSSSLGRFDSRGHGHGHVSSIGPGGFAFPEATCGASGPERGRPFGRAGSRSSSSSSSRSKSHSRTRKEKRKEKHKHKDKDKHGHKHYQSQAYAPGHTHGHGHAGSLSPVGSSHAIAFPGAGVGVGVGVGAGMGAGMYDAYGQSGNGGHGAGGSGSYAPVHSHPVGFGAPGPGPGLGYGHGHGYGHGQQGYAPEPCAPAHGHGRGGYGAGPYSPPSGPPPPHLHQGYAMPGSGYGPQGPGYDTMGMGMGGYPPPHSPPPAPHHVYPQSPQSPKPHSPHGGPQQPQQPQQQQYAPPQQPYAPPSQPPYGQQGYGYTPHPSSGYYAPYGSPNAGTGGGGGGTGGLQGGLNSALQAVEGIAGRQTRMQLEKTVGSLFNKRK